jgi:hypothetical protein
MAQYLDIIGQYFPDSQVSIKGTNQTVYANIVWQTTAIPQATLDQYANLVGVEFNANTLDSNNSTNALYVYNNTGSTIAANTPVYITGVETISKYPTIAKCTSATLATLKCVGLTSMSMAPNTRAEVFFSGLVQFNTSSFSVGAILYVGSNGTLTSTKPSNFSQQVGYVYSVGTLGMVFVAIEPAIDTQSSSSARFLSYSFSDLSYPYLRTNSYSYTTLSSFLWPGTNVIGTPTSVKFIAWTQTTTSTNASIRLFDSSNCDEIGKVEDYGYGINSPTIITMSLYNFPSYETIVDVQLFTNSSKYAYVSALSIQL